MKTTYFVEITDTFDGEANYSWVTRHLVKAKSVRGCANALSRRSGLNWHKTIDYGDCARYDSVSGATCAFISEYDPEYHSNYRFATLGA